MSANATSPNDSPPTSRWRLWIDGCGGFLLLTGNRWSVGGLGESDPADICVRADCPRRAGEIERSGGDYFWVTANGKQRELISKNRPLPMPGSARMTLRQPSPLSGSASIEVEPPHRLDGHVDAVVLVEDTFLIGPGNDNHIRCDLMADRGVITRRDQDWLGKAGSSAEFERFRQGQRVHFAGLAITLEQA